MSTEDSLDGVDTTTTMPTILNATMVSFMTTLANFSTTIAQNTTSDSGANYTEFPRNLTSSPEPEQNITTVANVTTTQVMGPIPVKVFHRPPLKLLSRLCSILLFNHNEAAIELLIELSSINKQE